MAPRGVNQGAPRRRWACSAKKNNACGKKKNVCGYSHGILVGMNENANLKKSTRPWIRT